MSDLIPDPPEDPRDAIHRLNVELEDKARPLGLYFDSMSVGSHDPEVMKRVTEDPAALNQAIKDGEEFVLMANFVIGDIAWATRTQDPEQHEFNKQAQVIMPDPAEEMKEKIKRLQAEGKSIFDDPEEE